MSVIDQQEQIRSTLVERLRRDLLGPSSPDEELIQDRETGTGDTPLGRYLLGILYPGDSPVTPEEDDSASEGSDDDELNGPEARVQVTGVPRPASIGMSFALAGEIKQVAVKFRYGLYTRTEVSTSIGADNDSRETQTTKPKISWQRAQQETSVVLDIEESEPGFVDMPGKARGEWLCRSDVDNRVISIFLRNMRDSESFPDTPENCIYQPEIIAQGIGEGAAPVVHRASLKKRAFDEPDHESYRLLYRDKPQFAVGHGCATSWDNHECPPGRARLVRTELLPSCEVIPIEARSSAGVHDLEMDRLASLEDGNAVVAMLRPLLTEYELWIGQKRIEIASLPPTLHTRAEEHIGECQEALDRMYEGLELLRVEPVVLEAFKFANQAMKLQRQRSVESSNLRTKGKRIFTGTPPAWRPFQIAFILLNLKSIVVPDCDDRQLADLLWFPTGGGKTEAYLGLAAFTIGLRRLRHKRAPESKVSGDGGVTVIMRYTLRLLTIQQFQRAAILICACEVMRRQKPDLFGYVPFSIGLWVGGGATPNSIDQSQEQYGLGALQVLASFDPKNEPAEGNPVQLRSCPWCGESLSYEDYRVFKEMKHLRIRCPNEQCDFHALENDPMSGIPAYVVDEEIYFRCPTMVIGTVDKFARLPWEPQTKSLFGKVDRYCERHGFIVEAKSHEGSHRATTSLPAMESLKKVPPFLPPELIIQDELHLITGPLGSLTGIYEGAIDFLCSWAGYKPKIIASTATIRRYQDQIRGLFNREARQFPPPGLVAGDSYFASENSEKPGRVYLGICASGKSMKTAAARILGSLMHNVERERLRLPDPEVIDPYWTVVYYFNSLRELGGALRLVDDDVRQRLIYLANSDGLESPRTPERCRELTGRISAREITELLRRMEETSTSDEALDVLFCTNMISVGVDIQRLGLMVVTGQPKTSAEYIQATSRVGRQTPGLILTLYNWSRPRDLSHYESFISYHSMLYSHVEASSVTPYSPRSRDKALHALLIAVLRLLDPDMSENDGAQRFERGRPLVREFTDYILQRVQDVDPDEAIESAEQLRAFMDGWIEQQALCGEQLKYRATSGRSASSAALIQPAEGGSDHDFPKPTLNSLREVEKQSGLYFIKL